MVDQFPWDGKTHILFCIAGEVVPFNYLIQANSIETGLKILRHHIGHDAKIIKSEVATLENMLECLTFVDKMNTFGNAIDI